MVESNEEMVPLREAENEVKVVTQRLALLHLAYGRILVDRFGWEEGKQLIMDSIKEYAKRVAERTKAGHQSLPKYGFWERNEDSPPICELGKIVREYNEMDIGSLYCLIDPAKIMWGNPEEKLIHNKAYTVGDDCCEFETVPTTEKDKDDLFGESKDWSHVDPRLYEYYKEKERKK
jgi:hypothetical protein